jgi:hypothetical protein
MVTWDKTRLAKLSTVELRQLKDNAFARGRDDIVELCKEALDSRPIAPQARQERKKPRLQSEPRLVSRKRAFEMRGVKVRNPRWSWGGIRESDGSVVLTLWAANEQRDEKGTRFYRLWAPNIDGKRPWADTAGGKERLKHCEIALQQGWAEGFLIYGDQRARELPGDQPSVVHGADPHTVIRLRIIRHGEDYLGIVESGPAVTDSHDVPEPDEKAVGAHGRF